ncbi:MAG: DUF1345 domain-containing protein [Vitreimonas sp.]
MNAIAALFKRKTILVGVAFGVAVAMFLHVAANSLTPLTRGLAAWDVGVIGYLATLFWLLRHATPDKIAAKVAATDDGRFFILFISLLGFAVSIAAIVAEAGQAAAAHGADKPERVAFVLITVALSWLFVHTAFANHYAHEFYGQSEDNEARGGLIFPGDLDPNFWDFLHFGLVIGVANQTADIQISSKAIRNVVTIHGIIAFVFNTMILALAINFAASMI